MCEVERLPDRLDHRPAHPRHAALTEANRLAGKQTQSRDPAVLLTPLERELQPETDPEHGLPFGHARTKRLVVAALAQPGVRRPGGADAGKNGQVGTPHVLDELAAEPLERERDRADVARAVAAERDVHRSPFVDGSPSDSVLTAARR